MPVYMQVILTSLRIYKFSHIITYLFPYFTDNEDSPFYLKNIDTLSLQ